MDLLKLTLMSGLARGDTLNSIDLLHSKLEKGTHLWGRSAWYIYTYSTISKSEPLRDGVKSSYTAATARIENVLTSLRLVDRALVYVGGFYSDEGSPFAGEQGGYRSFMASSMFGLPSSEFVIFAEYTLDNHKISSLTPVCQQLSSLGIPARNSLHVPIGRFSDSYMHLDNKDKLIDLCIALESLYVRVPQEVTYKLALRGAYYLEGDAEERCRTFKRIKKVYDARSKIVHGGAKQPKNLDELVDDAQEYLRRSIRKLLANPDDVHKIMKVPKENEIHFMDEFILKSGILNTESVAHVDTI